MWRRAADPDKCLHRLYFSVAGSFCAGLSSYSSPIQKALLMPETPHRAPFLEELLAAARPTPPPPPITVHAAPGATVIIYTQPPGLPENPPPAAKSG